MSFSNSSGFCFDGRPTFNHVHGNQVNHHTFQTITGGVIHVHDQNTTQVTERTRYDEFDVIKTGHVIYLKDLQSKDLSKWDWHWKNGKLAGRWRGSTRKTISTVQIHPDRQSKFTAITYKGEGAQQVWEEDFEHFSHASRTGFFQLFGINRSEIPMLIFHNELIPVAHFYTETLWMNVYIYCLREKRGCSRENLWLDAGSGVLCEGPTGPDFITWAFDTDASAVQALPLTLDMLEEGTSVAFFSKFGSNVNEGVLHCARGFYERIYLDDLFPKTTQVYQREHNNRFQRTSDYPYLKRLWRINPPQYLPVDLIGELRFDTVYYSSSLHPISRWPPEAHGLWEWTNVDGLVEETQVDGGLTRFKLNSQGGKVHLKAAFSWETFWKGWLLQSSRAFDPLKTAILVDPPWWLELKYAPDGLPALVEETRPIYLFLYPLPMTISELIFWMGGYTHFWSSDESGRTRIPEEEWKQWGIPILTLRYTYSAELKSWPTHIYTALRNWQIARGFDPSTPDWARECGYPEFEIVGAKKDDRLEEISEQQPVVVAENSGWNWSWNAFAGSDISAFAC